MNAYRIQEPQSHCNKVQKHPSTWQHVKEPPVMRLVWYKPQQYLPKSRHSLSIQNLIIYKHYPLPFKKHSRGHSSFEITSCVRQCMRHIISNRPKCNVFIKEVLPLNTRKNHCILLTIVHRLYKLEQ